jgi:hypothetical protein
MSYSKQRQHDHHRQHGQETRLRAFHDYDDFVSDDGVLKNLSGEVGSEMMKRANKLRKDVSMSTRLRTLVALTDSGWYLIMLSVMYRYRCRSFVF